VVDADGNRRVYSPNDPDKGYHDAAVARGLLEDNSVWVRTLEEANRERMGCRAFRRFFAFTCMHSIPPDRQALFNHFLDQLVPQNGNETADQQRERAYQHLEYIFRQWDTTCHHNGLEGPRHFNEAFVEQELQREPSTEFVADDPDAHQTRNWWRRYADNNRARFNTQQATDFERIMAALNSTDPNIQRLFRLKGEAGSGVFVEFIDGIYRNMTYLTYRQDLRLQHAYRRA
jgi:hypothetical protein